MFDLFCPNVDACVVSFTSCVLLRELLILTLPDRLAGPGGSFIDTKPRG